MSSARQPENRGPLPGDERDQSVRIAELEAELASLRSTAAAAHRREQQLTQHNLVLVNLSRSAAIEQGDKKAAFEEITLAAAHTLDVDRASIWMFTDDRSAIRCVDLYQRTDNAHSNGLELRAADFPAYFAAIEDNRTLAADDAQRDPRTAEFTKTYLGPLGISSMLDAPVRMGGRLVGVICHEHIGDARSWSLEDQAFAGSLADFVALTMQAHERSEALRAACSSERRLRQIIDLVPHMILVKAADGTIVLGNKAAADAYGVQVDRLIGMVQWDVHTRLDEAAFMHAADLRVLDAGMSMLATEERFTGADGARRLLQTTRIPLPLADSDDPAVLSVSIDVTQRKADEQARELMIQELDHRVKNNLAIVIAIAEQTAGNAVSIEGFTNAFSGRLRALAISHEMLARTRWEGADLRAMIDRLTEPYATGNSDSRVKAEGESLQLPATIAPSVCMILHELTTNAAKHGALSTPQGHVAVHWQREMHHAGDHRVKWLRIEWQEHRSPERSWSPTEHRPGFGMSLIEQTVSYQLRGRCHFDRGRTGMTAIIEFPLERALRAGNHDTPPMSDVTVFASTAERESPRVAAVPSGSTEINGTNGQDDHAIAGRRVLVVEDDLLVAQSIASHLQAMGCEVIGPVATSDDACALVKSRPIDAAILDVNLSAGTSAPIARALAGRRTPFVFVTGYSSLKALPDELRGRRVLCKPVDREMLSRALREMAPT